MNVIATCRTYKIKVTFLILSAIVATIAAAAVSVGTVCSRHPDVTNDSKEDPDNNVEDDSNDNGHPGVGASLL